LADPLASFLLRKNIAIQSYLPAEEGLIVAYDNGYTHWYIDLSLPCDALEQWSTKRVKCLADDMDIKNISPIIHGNFNAPLSSNIPILREAAVSYVKRELELAAQFSAPVIIHGGAIVEPRLVTAAKRSAIDNFVKSIKELYEYGTELGVRVWVENLSNYTNNHPFYYIFSTRSEFRYVLEKCPELEIFLDLGHANIGNDNIHDLIGEFSHNISGISLSNNNGMRDQHFQMVKGSVDYSLVFNKLIKTNWFGFLAFEVRDLPPDKVLRQARTLYKEVLFENAISCV
jgi:L-ribulose-5-phosphate 3-epimerase